ncbi:MAG TPA: redoxin domain-containing protein, partial [Actinomycetota bacterium]|nr:redoxin domain-containing protein [Actinomycetota bacterium]
MRRDPRIVAAVVALLVAVGVAAFRITASGSNRPGRAGDTLLFRNDPAPELVGLSQWFNAEPMTLKALRGKVVLIDFWTFSCVNCVRTFPEIRAFYDTYKNAGLEVIGIHSPEFDFEKSPDNVRKAMRAHSVVWPVAMDNDHKTWEAFRNRFWPHVYLIDAEGRIRYDRVGEGGAAEIERAIRALLDEAGVALPPPTNVTVKGPSGGITPEIYLGWLRGEQQKFLGNESGFVRDRPHDYLVPLDPPAGGAGTAAYFLEGRWRATEQFVEAAAAVP